MTPALIDATGLSHVTMRVTDLARSIEWYSAVLGYEVLWDGLAPTPDRTRSAMGLICAGGLALELLQTPGGRPHDVNALGVAALSITVPDIGAALEAFIAAGYGRDIRPIEAQDWKVAFLFDPDGNVVELVQQPGGVASIANFAPTLRARRDGVAP